MKEMKTSRGTTFLGRNGTFKCMGFTFDNIWEISQQNNWVAGSYVGIQPITTKGVTGRCRIEIPKEDVGKFCAHLQLDLVSLIAKELGK